MLGPSDATHHAVNSHDSPHLIHRIRRNYLHLAPSGLGGTITSRRDLCLLILRGLRRCGVSSLLDVTLRDFLWVWVFFQNGCSERTEDL